MKRYKKINDIGTTNRIISKKCIHNHDPLELLLNIADDIQCIQRTNLKQIYMNNIHKVPKHPRFPGWCHIITEIFKIFNNVSMCVENIMESITLLYPQWGEEGPCGGKTVKNTIFQMCGEMAKENTLIIVWRDTKKGRYYKLK